MGWETQKAIESLQLHILHQLLKCHDYLRVKLYLFERVLGPLRTICGNWVKSHNS